jgi:hypothetical protein
MSEEGTGNTKITCGGCSGCMIFALVIIFFWALFFGVTVAGKHYELTCNSKQGVKID